VLNRIVLILLRLELMMSRCFFWKNKGRSDSCKYTAVEKK
jgi:hypothetical protein